MTGRKETQKTQKSGRSDGFFLRHLCRFAADSPDAGVDMPLPSAGISRRAAVVGLAGVILAGCGAPKPETPASQSNSATPTAPAGGKKLRIALVLDTGGVDDKSFNASAYAGLQRAQKELGVDGKYVESKVPADYKTNLTQFASQGYDLVFAVGYKMADALKEVAAQFPNVKFAIIDSEAPSLPNCAGLLFTEEQGCFLAGYLAGAVSKTHTIGFVGGEEIPLIKKFESGYRAGAMTANPVTKVLASYTGDWNDINKGKSQAQQEFGNGADIVFQAAGKAGQGVIEAAREKGSGYYAIGVDSDQDDIAPGRVLVSELKRLDNVVFDTVKDLTSGKFTTGNRRFDLKEGGVDISEMKYTKQEIPADVLKHLETARKMIADGTLKVPTTAAELNAFQPPKI
jgi:basic membrane protein A